jgi:tetratricopeptide (TPR) repeat protein
LVDKSLLRVSVAGRYDRHPLLYQYTQEKLAKHPEEQAQARAAHGTFYFHFLQARNGEMNSEAQKEGLAATLEELENIRAAWGWAVAESKLEALQWAVEPLTLFYDRQARYAEGIKLLGEALPRLDEADPLHQLALGNVLVGQAFLYQWSSNYPQALSSAERALALLRPLAGGEAAGWGVMVGIDTLGFVAAFTGNYTDGKRFWAEALDLAKAQGNTVKTAELSSIVGMVECWLGNQTAAKAHLDEAMVLTPRLGKHTAVIYILLNLGFMTILSDPKGARRAFEQSLHLARELGYKRHLPYLLYGLGWSFYYLGQYPKAQAYCQEAVEVSQESGNLFAKAMALTILAAVAIKLGDYAEAQNYFRESLRLSELTQSLFCTFVALAYLTDLYAKRGRIEEAAELLGLILNHPKSDFCADAIAKEVLTVVQNELPVEVLGAALARGKAMRLDGAVAKILRRGPLESYATP